MEMPSSPETVAAVFGMLAVILNTVVVAFTVRMKQSTTYRTLLLHFLTPLIIVNAFWVVKNTDKELLYESNAYITAVFQLLTHYQRLQYHFLLTVFLLVTLMIYKCPFKANKFIRNTNRYLFGAQFFAVSLAAVFESWTLLLPQSAQSYKDFTNEIVKLVASAVLLTVYCKSVYYTLRHRLSKVIVSVIVPQTVFKGEQKRRKHLKKSLIFFAPIGIFNLIEVAKTARCMLTDVSSPGGALTGIVTILSSVQQVIYPLGALVVLPNNRQPMCNRI